MLAMSEPSMQHKPIEYGDGLIVRNLDDKILISAQCATRIREGNFLLQGEEIIIEAGRGIRISSRHPNILVIEANLTKMEEKVFDLQQEVNKRLEVIEKVFGKILKQVKT